MTPGRAVAPTSLMPASRCCERHQTPSPRSGAGVTAGPHGFLSIAAHAHADALSVEVRHGGVEILVDPGTYCYHGEPGHSGATSVRRSATTRSSSEASTSPSRVGLSCGSGTLGPAGRSWHTTLTATSCTGPPNMTATRRWILLPHTGGRFHWTKLRRVEICDEITQLGSRGRQDGLPPRTAGLVQAR